MNTLAPRAPGAGKVMNVHHLELFYHVATHGGISAAARHMPYGIQQPAISAQILQLEAVLGVSLFQRRPFQLTGEGQSLYDHIRPFFSGLPDLEERIRGGAETRLRIATAEVVQREYLPELLARMRRRVPGFRFLLTQGRQAEIETMLLSQQVDVGIGMVTDQVAPGVQTRELTRLPLVLLVPESSPVHRAGELLERDRLEIPLITLGCREPLPRAFQEALRDRGTDWPPALELGSLDLVARYVAQGFGVGLGIHLPGIGPFPGTRALPLEDFPSLPFCALWTGRLSPLAERFLEESRALANALGGN